METTPFISNLRVFHTFHHSSHTRSLSHGTFRVLRVELRIWERCKFSKKLSIFGFYFFYSVQVPPPFPLPTVSPLVSESTSPNHSRSTSPHRTIVTLRSTPMPPPQTPRPIDTIPTQLPPPQPIDPLSSNNFPFLHPVENVKIPDEDVSWI